MSTNLVTTKPLLLEPEYRFDGCSDAWTFRRTATLVKYLAWRNLALRYRGSRLGFVWSLLNPIFLMAVYTFVFNSIFQARIPGIPYHVFFFTGILAWNLVNVGSMAAAVSLLDGSSLIKKMAFPRFVLPLSAIVSSAANYVITVPVLLIFNLIFGIQPTPYILLLPVALLLLMSVGLGMGLLLAPVVPRFRDVQHLIEVLFVAWFFMSPVLYPATQVTQNVSHEVSFLYGLNPMVGVMELVHLVFLGQPMAPLTFVVALVGITFLFVLGFSVFRRFAESVSEL
jgi:ABC-type polysaccharide/polyol phosphate export permease